MENSILDSFHGAGTPAKAKPNTCAMGGAAEGFIHFKAREDRANIIGL